MKHRISLPVVAAAVAAVVFLNACETTSISNVSGRNPFYHGEIAETDLLGLSANGSITEESIRTTLARSSHKNLRLRQGEHVLLIQSGSPQPDGSLSTAFQKHVSISPYSGQPIEMTANNLRQRITPEELRMAAARAGASKIVCVWGLVESAHAPTGLEAVSWVPVVGLFLPDKRTVSRLTLKGMVMDTATGVWHSYTTQPVACNRITAGINEEYASVSQTERMKADAYTQLARLMSL